MQGEEYLYITALSLLSSALMTLLLMPLVVRLAKRVGAVDHPDARKVHRQVMPRMGGLTFMLCLLVIPASVLPFSDEMTAFVAGLLVVALVGLADDIVGIAPKWKFSGLFIAATLFVVLGDTSITNLGNLFGWGEVETGVLAIPVTVVATVGFINALNLSDGLDGLAAGIAFIAVFFLGCFSLLIGDQSTLLLSVALLGSMIGFLYFNSHPARVFMGDTGSLVLGYVLAAISLLLIKSSQGSGDASVSPVMMGTLLGLPLADTLFVMGKRIRNGTSPFLPDKTHFHHRLMHLGMPHNGVVGAIYVLMAIYGIAAIALGSLPAWGQLLALLGLIAATYTLLHLVEQSGWRIHFSGHDSVDERSGEGVVYQRMTRLTGQSIPYVTFLIPLALAVPAVLIELEGEMIVPVFASILLAMVLYPWREEGSVAWSNGVLYLLVFMPILCVNIYTETWLQEYLLYVTALLAFWVVLKLYFRRHGRIFLSTGLEMLLLLASWLLPWLIVEFGLISEAFEVTLYQTCFQSVIFLLATKIVLRHQPRRNRVLLVSLLLLNTLLLV